MKCEEVRACVLAALAPKRFRGELAKALRLEERVETLRWEIFRGHLLDPHQTRQERTFTSWLVYLDHDCAEPTLALRLDARAAQLYVIRSLLVHGHEPFEEEGVIRSRAVVKWQRELVGTIDLAVPPCSADLQDWIEHYLFLALIGTSRLPVTSLESPLPVFALGKLSYLPARSSRLHEAKELEFCLRSCQLEEAKHFAQRDDFGELVRVLFNNLAMSPWTGVVSDLTNLIMQTDPAKAGDLLSYMLRHLVRHLTAFDLQVFHNRGANFPDALALDLWLRALLKLLDEHPELAEQRWTRRAIRQAWLVRKQVEGLRVPDHPTSPGENLRVLPAPFERLPEEQVLQPDQRTRRLFDQEPAEALLSNAARTVLLRAMEDLERDDELLELGLAGYLDRPFGVFKRPGEVDRTPLFAYEAFSRSIAVGRLSFWQRQGFLDSDRHGKLLDRILHGLTVKGVSVLDLPGQERPGVVALEDALRASPDFVILRATRGTLALARDIFRPYLSPQLLGILDGTKWLPIRSPRQRIFADPSSFITVFDSRLEPLFELGLGQTAHEPVRYREQAGMEQLAEGLRLLHQMEVSLRTFS